FSMPWSTNFWSTSLSTTSRPAAAMTWAISPPIVPAPTTAALNTYMRPPVKLSRWLIPRHPTSGVAEPTIFLEPRRLQRRLFRRLAGEPRARPRQRVPERAPDEQEVRDRRERAG